MSDRTGHPRGLWLGILSVLSVAVAGVLQAVEGLHLGWVIGGSVIPIIVGVAVEVEKYRAETKPRDEKESPAVTDLEAPLGSPVLDVTENSTEGLERRLVFYSEDLATIYLYGSGE